MSTSAHLKEQIQRVKKIDLAQPYTFWKQPIKASQTYFKNRETKRNFTIALNDHYTSIDKQNQARIQQFLPRDIEVKAGYIQIEGKYSQTLFLGSLPDIVHSGHFIDILNLPIPFTLSYTFEGTKKSKLLKSCNSMIAGLNGRLEFERNNGRTVNNDVTNEIEEIMKFIQDLGDGFEEAFYLSVYIHIISESKEQLESYTKQFLDEVSDMDLNFFNSYVNQKDALLQILPINKVDKENKHVVSSRAMMNLSPLLASDVNEMAGIYLGNNLVNGSMIILNLFTGTNNNMNIFGKAGSGKSYLSKLIISRLLLRGVQHVIIDPEGEYVALAREYGGEVISFNRDIGINPFFVPSQERGVIQDHVIKLKEFFTMFIPSQHQDPGLLGFLITDYFRITLPQERNMESFLDFIEGMKGTQIPFLLDLLEMRLDGSLGGFFSSTEHYDLTSEFIILDFHQIQEETVKLPVMYLLTKLVASVAGNKERETLIVVDEAHLMLQHKMTGEFLQTLSKTVRKRNTGLVCISQETEDFRIENGGKTIITQAETNIILKQSGASLNYIRDNGIIPLTKEERNDITSFNDHEGYIIRQNQHILFKAKAFAGEEEFVRTDFK